MIGVMEVIPAPKSVSVQENLVRVIEFINVYSSLETQAEPGSKKKIGLGDEYFLEGVQVFIELGKSILCTQLKCLQNQSLKRFSDGFEAIKLVLKAIPN